MLLPVGSAFILSHQKKLDEWFLHSEEHVLQEARQEGTGPFTNFLDSDPR
jgi:hypothetical protein